MMDVVFVENEIKKDIEEAFRMNNLAWMKRSQDIARDYSSDQLNDCKNQTTPEATKIIVPAL